MHVWCFIQDHGMSEIFTGAGEPDQQATVPGSTEREGANQYYWLLSREREREREKKKNSEN